MSFWPMERRTLGQREERGYSHQQGARQHTQASSHVAWSPIDLSHPETSDVPGERRMRLRGTQRFYKAGSCAGCVTPCPLWISGGTQQAQYIPGHPSVVQPLPIILQSEAI